MIQIVKLALAEDIGSGDITTQGMDCGKDKVRAVILAQARGIVAGLPVVQEVFHQLSQRVQVDLLATDGAEVKAGMPVARLLGPANPILTGERTALNFLGMLSGIATYTAKYVQAVAGTSTRVFDTRKTVPGLRALVKYAVLLGGGSNHRQGLYDAVLIKDNHIRLAGSLTAAVARMRQRCPRGFPVEVEVDHLSQVPEAVAAQADIILLDNFSVRQIRQAIKIIPPHIATEISGGLDEKTIKILARLGIKRVSVGAITHSAPWLPLHLELE